MGMHITGVASACALTLALLVGVTAYARAPVEDAPVRAVRVRTITITPITTAPVTSGAFAAAILTAEPGLRFGPRDADGCASVSGAGRPPETFCPH